MNSRPTPRLLLLAGALLVGLALVACATAEKDAGSFGSLPPDKPILKEYHGAQVYLLRQGDEDVVAFWGMSPLTGGENVRCFIQDRSDRTFQGESLPFVDPCRSAWWASDGRFLGYTNDATEVPSSGPPLVRIPAEVRDGRVILDEDYLQCLQNRRADCESRQ
ncbi:MAG: hypothetical protein AB7R89_09780 [Dehalococcoidia bacterium]